METEFESKIKSLTLQDWKPLLALIPEIENTSTFGKWHGGEKNKEGVFQFPYTEKSPIVSKFLEIAYAVPIIIGFDWGAWKEGPKMEEDEDFDFDTVDLVTRCKLITAIVRSDRFCDGSLLSAFESGLILKVLKSIERELHSST